MFFQAYIDKTNMVHYAEVWRNQQTTVFVCDFVLACLSVTHWRRRVWNQHCCTIMYIWKDKNRWNSATISHWFALWWWNIENAATGQDVMANPKPKSPSSSVPSQHMSDPPSFRQPNDIVCVPPNISATIIWIHYIPTVVVSGCATHAKFYGMCFFFMSVWLPFANGQEHKNYRLQNAPRAFQVNREILCDNNVPIALRWKCLDAIVVSIMCFAAGHLKCM